MEAVTTKSLSFRSLRSVTRLRVDAPQARYVHSTCAKAAVAHPVNVQGPPPSPPAPASGYRERLERRRRHAEQIKQGTEASAQNKGSTKETNLLKRRFWKDVHVKEEAQGYRILLDSRPVRTPNTKATLIVPRSKPHLAHTIALEWDVLHSAQQALKNHRIPLTSLISRAQDIAEQDARGETFLRDEIADNMLRYLDTDTLLSWAPAKDPHEPAIEWKEGDGDGSGGPPESLRDLQVRIARPILGFLINHVWPGVEIQPTLEEESIIPTSQPPATKEVLRGWMAALPAYEIAGLERGVLASKSFLVAVRLVIEWSEHFRYLQPKEGPRDFGIEKATEASSLEVAWQISRWGEVEDSHDVEKEDLKRQLGSVIALVAGEANR